MNNDCTSPYEVVQETLATMLATGHVVLPEAPESAVLETAAKTAQITLDQARQAYAAIHALVLGEALEAGADPLAFRQKLLAGQPPLCR